MTFENWMTQRYSYEYSKGEYRDHDMQAAYTIGLQSSTPYTEGYAKGYSDGKSTRDCKDCDNQLYTIGYADGVQAERERCARIAESYDSKTEYSYACYDQGKDDTASDIAAAIWGKG